MADLSPDDRDWVIRTIAGEADHPAGDVAVASVIRNRLMSRLWGDTAKAVVTAPGQFSSLNALTGYAGGAGANNLVNLQRGSPDYNRIGKIVDAVWSGTADDPTRGALNFYAPSGMPGGRAPAWWSQVSNPIRIGAQWYGTASGENARVAGRQPPPGTTLTSTPDAAPLQSAPPSVQATAAPPVRYAGSGAAAFPVGSQTSPNGTGQPAVAAAPGSVMGPPGMLSGTQPSGAVNWAALGNPGGSQAGAGGGLMGGLSSLAQGLGGGGSRGSGQGGGPEPPPAPPLMPAIAHRPNLGALAEFAQRGQTPAMVAGTFAKQGPSLATPADLSSIAAGQLAQLNAMTSPYYGTSIGSMPIDMSLGGFGGFGGWYG